jgi:hypothetical protein
MGTSRVVVESAQVYRSRVAKDVTLFFTIMSRTDVVSWRAQCVRVCDHGSVVDRALSDRRSNT